MPHLLDTNICIRHLRNPRKSPLADRLAGRAYGDVVLCSVVKAELIFGALHGKQQRARLARLDNFLSLFPSIPFDDLAARVYGEVRAELARQGLSIGPNDLLIASIALANHLVLVTHNTSEFGRVPGLQIEDWEESP
jgi:tRNA(fMet)-specific endonuclease VapC